VQSHRPDTAVTIRGQAMLAVARSAIDPLRDAAPPAGAALPPRFLRHADEHTVVGINALSAAIAAAGFSAADLAGCAVVAAPRLAGRPAAARTLTGWAAQGHATVSPHIVPWCSLHAMASAVSVALGCHGPHLGVGGGPEAVGEALAMLPWLVGHGGSAVLLVATGWDDEPLLATDGTGAADAVCRAVALVVAPAAHGGLRLAHVASPAPRPRRDADELLRFGQFAAAAAAGPTAVRPPAAWSFAARRGGVIRAEVVAALQREAA